MFGLEASRERDGGEFVIEIHDAMEEPATAFWSRRHTHPASWKTDKSCTRQTCDRCKQRSIGSYVHLTFVWNKVAGIKTLRLPSRRPDEYERAEKILTCDSAGAGICEVVQVRD